MNVFDVRKCVVFYFARLHLPCLHNVSSLREMQNGIQQFVANPFWIQTPLTPAHQETANRMAITLNQKPKSIVATQRRLARLDGNLTAELVNYKLLSEKIQDLSLEKLGMTAYLGHLEARQMAALTENDAIDLEQQALDQRRANARQARRVVMPAMAYATPMQGPAAMGYASPMQGPAATSSASNSASSAMDAEMANMSIGGGSAQIIVKDIHGKPLIYDVDLADKASLLFERVFAGHLANGCDPAMCRLCINGLDLNPDKTLGEHGLSNLSGLEMIFRLRGGAPGDRRDSDDDDDVPVYKGRKGKRNARGIIAMQAVMQGASLDDGSFEAIFANAFKEIENDMSDAASRTLGDTSDRSASPSEYQRSKDLGWGRGDDGEGDEDDEGDEGDEDHEDDNASEEDEALARERSQNIKEYKLREAQHHVNFWQKEVNHRKALLGISADEEKAEAVSFLKKAQRELKIWQKVVIKEEVVVKQEVPEADDDCLVCGMGLEDVDHSQCL